MLPVYAVVLNSPNTEYNFKNCFIKICVIVNCFVTCFVGSATDQGSAVVTDDALDY